MEDSEKSRINKSNLKAVNSYARYSSLGIQMGVIIFIGVWLGQWLDETYPLSEHPLYTVVCSLLGVAFALYLVLRGVLKIQKNKEQNEK